MNPEGTSSMDPVSDPIVDPWINQPDFDDGENDVILGARRRGKDDQGGGEGDEGNRRRKKGKKGKGQRNGGQNQNQGGGKQSKNKGGGGGGGDKGAKEYERFAPTELSKTELEAAIASVVEDPSLREPEKEEIEEVPSEVEIQKAAFLQKCDGVLAHQEAWEAEAALLRQKDSPSIDERLRTVRLMKRLTLVMHYERFQNAVKEIDELKEKLKTLQEEQRQDAIRLKAILKHTEATQEERKKKEDVVKAAQKFYEETNAALSKMSEEEYKENIEVGEKAEMALDAAKADQAALQELPEHWEQIQAGLVRRMRNRTESIDEGNDTFVDLTDKLEKMMGDLAIVEHEAGNIEDPETGEAFVGEQTMADRVADRTQRVMRAVGQGTVKAAKTGGKVGYIGGLGTVAVGAGLLSVPMRFLATQWDRLYRFSMNPSVLGKGVDRIKKFYQDEGIWDGTNDALKWLLLGDPQKDEKKKEKKS